MKRRLSRFEWPLLACLLAIAPGCMLLVGDGDYTVGADGSASSGSASGLDAEGIPDSASPSDGAHSGSSGTGVDGSQPEAGVSEKDASSPPADGGSVNDATSSGLDGASPPDAGTTPDAGAPPDAGSPDAGNPACVVTAADDECGSCNKTSCCTAVANCGTDCSNVLDCLNNCTTSPCGCFDQFPAGVTTFLALLQCQNTQCAASCGFFDDGDPCVTSDSCALDCGSTAPHAGLWCTNECFDSTDCVNEETQSGDDIFGEVNSCIDDQGTSTCFPGCVAASDCEAYPGTSCQQIQSVEGDTVSVCRLQ